jgi:Aldo/keto reductase family
MKSRWSRRDFLKTTSAAVVFGTAEQALGAASSTLPKRRLGKTGEMISCIGFGSGSRFCSIENEDAAQALLERAFDRGVNYFDTAGSYTRRPLERLSEKRLGKFSKKRRKDIFLATKIDPRDRDGALRSVETSLKFLQTDYIYRSDSNPQPEQSRRPRAHRQPRQRSHRHPTIETAKSRPLNRHHRPQRWHGYGRGAAMTSTPC